MRRKFAVFYCPHNPDPNKAGKRYKPPRGKMLVMNAAGVFFEYDNGPYYPYIKPLVDVIGNFDVLWNDPKEDDVPSPFKGDSAFLPIQCHMGTAAPSYVVEETRNRAMGKNVCVMAGLSDEELEAEMKRRKEAREAAKRPQPADNPDFGILLGQCAEYIKQLAAYGRYDEDLKDYVFEAAVEAIYGRGVWDWVAEKQS
jgi:hypothetical protein